MKKQQKQPTLFPEITDKGATFSECGKYRYSLWRIWDKSKPLVMFVGLNPSKADAKDDDQTIMSVTRISRNLGFGGFYMMNCFAYISTNPDELITLEEDPINDKALIKTGWLVKEVVFAYGNFKIIKQKGRDKFLSTHFPKAKCLIKNKDGSPHHPLYIPANIQLENFHK